MKLISHYFPFFIVTIILYGIFFHFHEKSTVISSLPINSGEQAIQLQFIEQAEEYPDEVTTTSPKEIEKEIIKETPKIVEAAKAEIKEAITASPITEKPTKDTSKTKPKIVETAKSEINKAIKTPEKQIEDTSKAKLKIVDIHSKNDDKIKIAKQKLQEAIKETSAINDASLKAELFTEEFKLEPEQITEQIAESPTTQKDKVTEQSTAVITPTPIATKTPKIKLIRSTKTAKKKSNLQQKKTKTVFKKQPTGSNVENQGVLQEAIVVSGNKPIYPKTAILRNQQGRVVVKITVNVKGKAKNPKIVTSSGHSILDNAVLDFIQNELFMPAHNGEEKITTDQIFSFRFELH